MHARVGDRIMVAGATVGAPARDGEIVEVHGREGEPPYLVRWSDTGRESLFFPGPDSHIDRDGSEEGDDETDGQATKHPAGRNPQRRSRSGTWTCTSTSTRTARRHTPSCTVRLAHTSMGLEGLA